MSRSQDRISILIVEDERIIAKDMAENLVALGYAVVGTAATGNEAVQKAIEFSPDVILMDIKLKGEMDGIEAAGIITEKIDAAVIYLTAYADKNTLERAKLTTPFGYLLKPFEERELQTTIEMANYKNRMDLKLRESERWLSTTLSSIGEAVISLNRDGKINFLNPSAEKLIGRGRKELIGHSAHEVLFIRKEGKEENLLKNFSSVSEEIYNDEEYILNIKDRSLPILLDLSPINNSREDISGYVLVIRDVSERKKAQQAILSREKRLSGLVETAMDAVITTDCNYTIVLFNKAAEKIFNYSADDIIGKEIEVLIPDRFRIPHRDHMKKFKNGKESLRGPLIDLYAIRSNGEEFPIEASISQFNVEDEHYFTVFLRDITEKKTFQQKILMLSSAVEQSSANIMISDIEGAIVYVNPKFEIMTGFKLDEIKGRKFDIISAGKDDPFLVSEFWDSLKSGKEWYGEFKNQRKDGSIYWNEALVSPIKDESGQIKYFLSINEDITKRKLQEEQLIVAKNNAEQANKLKSEFIAQISHEIRTPLNSILSFTGLLREEVEDKLSPELSGSFKIIDSSAGRLIRTIELLLNISKLQSGTYEAKSEQLDLKDMLEDLLLEFYTKARSKNLDLYFTNQAENSVIMGDPYTLGQIFSNLIENAIKYTNSGHIEILSRNEGDKTMVSVIDTGIGISKEYLPDLFTPFSQEEFGYTRRYEGTGLGLALVQKYVELNNADIRVESEKSKGSKFTVIFNRVLT